MPFRLDPEQFPNRAKIQFITSAEMPMLIYRARKKHDIPSQTVYIQRAVCEALARDLGFPLERLLDALPPPRALAASDEHLRRGKTIEEVGEAGVV